MNRRAERLRIRFGEFPPIRKQLCFGKKSLRLISTQSDFPRPVRFAANARDNVSDDSLERRLFGGFRRDDAVTVEARLGENLRCISRVLDGDGVSVFFAQIGKDLPSDYPVGVCSATEQVLTRVEPQLRAALAPIDPWDVGLA